MKLGICRRVELWKGAAYRSFSTVICCVFFSFEVQPAETTLERLASKQINEEDKTEKRVAGMYRRSRERKQQEVAGDRELRSSIREASLERLAPHRKEDDFLELEITICSFSWRKTSLDMFSNTTAKVEEGIIFQTLLGARVALVRGGREAQAARLNPSQ